MAFYANQLTKPIFPNHYYDLAVYNNSFPNLDFYYLVNRRKPMDLVDFAIPGHTEIRWQVVHNETVETFSHQILKKATLNLVANPVHPLRPGTEIAFQEADVIFSDNTKFLAPIGQVYLAIIHAPSGLPLRWSSAGSSTGNTGYTVFQANHKVEISAFSYHFQDQLADNLRIMLDDTPARLPFTLNQGDSFKLGYQFDFPDKNNPLAANYYRIDGKLNVQTVDGVRSTVLTDMHYQPYFQEVDIKQLRLAREKT